MNPSKTADSCLWLWPREAEFEWTANSRASSGLLLTRYSKGVEPALVVRVTPFPKSRRLHRPLEIRSTASLHLLRIWDQISGNVHRRREDGPNFGTYCRVRQTRLRSLLPDHIMPMAMPR